MKSWKVKFDDKATRDERKATDPFAAIRDIWDIFINTCKTAYVPSTYMTIDEQLLVFRGKCPFRMYIPNKPAKYGIKIVMVCDTAAPYLGKKTNTEGLPLAEYFVKSVLQPFEGSFRNLTMDNWFTSVSLADQLLKGPYKTTLIGTIRKNKLEIPPEMLDIKNRKVEG
nr:unnamed protein product [Callosobruchus analis]